MKRTRLYWISFIAFAFALAQAPTAANCQLLAFSSVSQCSMPCCRHLSKSMPMPMNCPMLKTAPQPDAITPHANFLRYVLDGVAIFAKGLDRDAVSTFSRIPVVKDVFRLLYVERPSLGRAPPADITLLSA